MGTEGAVGGNLIPAAAAIFLISFSSRFFSFALRLAASPAWRWRAVACCSFKRCITPVHHQKRQRVDRGTYDNVRMRITPNVFIVLCDVRVLLITVFAIEGAEGVLDFGLSLFFNCDQILQLL